MFIDFSDEILCSKLDAVLSGLLPHENYKPETFASLYPILQQALAKESTSGVYYVMYTILNKYYSLSTIVSKVEFAVRITEERFKSALENNIPDLILDPKVNIKDIMNQEGKPADMSIPSVQQEAMNILYVRCLELYQRCFALCIPYEDAVANVVDLKDALVVNMINTSIEEQRAIISTGMWVGRRQYIGISGWLEYASESIRRVGEIGTEDDTDLVCDDVSKVDAIDSDIAELNIPLANYGIPQLDDKTPMLRHRLVVFVAKENVGKTKFMIHLTASLIRAGIKPFYASGETVKSKIVNEVTSSYLFQEYGLHFEPSSLFGKGLDELTPEDRQLVLAAKAKIAVSGLHVCTDMEYGTADAKMEKAYQEGCEAFFIDHSQSLRGQGNMTMNEAVTSLSLKCRDLKNKRPVFVCVASHPSTNLKDLLQKDKTDNVQQNTTAQSSTLANEADELFILYENDSLVKQGLVGLRVHKRRDAEKPPTIFLKKAYHVSSFIYDDKYQGANLVTDEDALFASMGYTDIVEADDEYDIELDEF